jgi:hypothetical protein
MTLNFAGIYDAKLWFDSHTNGVARRAVELAEGIERQSSRSGEPAILCLDRALFRKDIEEMQRRTELRFVMIPAARVKKAQEGWIAPQRRTQTYFYSYLESDLRRAREPLARFGRVFLETAMRRARISAVLAGNTDYWQDEAIKLGCESLGIPFLVLCRENYVWKKSADYVHSRFIDSRFKFRGRGVAVASEVTRQTLVSSGAFGADQVTVTGWPRFDSWLGRDAALQERDSIVLLSYAERRYLAPENFVDVLRIFAELALANQHRLKFVIKTKKANETDEIYDICPSLRASEVEVTGTRSLMDIYDAARLVIGYNSLAVLETMLSSTPVVVPWWGDAVRPQAECLLSAENTGDRSVAHFAKDAGQLKALIEQAISGPLGPLGTEQERLARFSAHSSFDPLKSSSQRVADWIVSELRASTVP